MISVKLSEIKDYESYIGKKGYIIRKEYYDATLLHELRKELTVKPNVMKEYSMNVEEFKLYRENEKKLYLPRMYAIKKLGHAKQNKVPRGLEININFKGDLREIQKLAVKKYLSTYDNDKIGGGIISLGCGGGKTVIALNIIQKLQRKTLIVVHKEFLMNQWIERIETFLPGAKIGRIQQKIFDVENKDIVIAMLQTIAMKNFSLDAFDSFGTVVIDEAHRIPSRVFSRALNKINATNMLGLSATPNRKDGLSKVLKWYIGDIVFSVNKSGEEEVDVDRYIIKSYDKIYNKELVGFNGNVKLSTMLNNICNYYRRTQLIINVIKSTTEDDDRKILILSDRKNQFKRYT